MKRRNPFLLHGSRLLNLGAVLSGLLFLLYVLAAAWGAAGAAEILAPLFGLLSLYVLVSAAAERRRDPTAASLNLILGQGALVLLACLCVLVMLKERGWI